MADGQVWQSDEQYALLREDGGTTYYYFSFPESGGAQGGGSVSPFAPKSTTGARGYQDYDVFSAIALSDLTSGMGQEILTDATAYYTAVNVDARGGKLVLGPLTHGSTGTGELSDPAMLQWETPTDATFAGEHDAITQDFPDSDNWGTTEVAPDFGERHWATFGLNRNRIAVRFNTATDQIALDRVWLYLKGPAVAADTLTVALYLADPLSSYPVPTTGHTTTLSAKNLTPTGGWVEAVFTGETSLAAANTYWLIVTVESANALDDYGWYGSTHLGTDARVLHSSTAVGTWEWWPLPADVADDYTPLENSDSVAYFANMLFWYAQPFVQPSAPPRFVPGAGEDGVRRIWLYAGKYLYYIGANSTPTIVSIVPPESVETQPWYQGEITTGAWFKGSGDSFPYLYLALKTTLTLPAYIYRCDGDVLGGVTFTPLGAAIQAQCFAVQDNMLWRAYSTNQVDGTLDGLWTDATGSVPGHTVSVGDKSYPVRNMLGWAGALYVGKDDGLYKVSYPIGYPLGDMTPTCVKVLDFSAQIAANNFELMCEHQGDLYFSLGLGLLRLTGSGVLTVVTPELGLELEAGSRGLYRAAASSLNVLWVLVEGQGGADSLSYLLACVDGNWHPIHTAPRSADMFRSLTIDGGLYGTLPRIWFGSGLQVVYLNMPTQSQKRWLYINGEIGADFWYSGYLLTSWIDGNIRTIEKDWCSVEVVCREVGLTNAAIVDPGQVTIYWRPDVDTAWSEVGTTTTEGTTTLTFPPLSHSGKCQLKIELTRSFFPYTTPIVEAVILKYLERPVDSKRFTRTYDLHHDRRNGAHSVLSIQEKLQSISDLRNSPEPIEFYAWWGSHYRVHILDFSFSDQRERMNDLQDSGSIIVTVNLIEVS
jgi:hypothetical protein